MDVTTTAAHEPGNDSSTLRTEIPKAPRRDKFASMAAMQELTTAVPRAPFSGVEPAFESDEVSSTTATAAPKKPDDAANAHAGAPQPKRDKFSSMAQQYQIPAVERIDACKKTASDSMKKFEMRIQQRQKVLKDLEIAEGHTWILIELASRTAGHLTKLKVKPSDTTLSKISSQYRDTLRRIHSLLSPHSKFVKAYQNHQEEFDATNMYAARVETRLAQERRNVLEELLKLEKPTPPLGIVVGLENKRKRDD